MGIVNSALRALVWWNDQTLGTQLFTWRNGIKVGDDAQGNIYYRNKDDSKRWVIYNGEIEASRVSPDWHGWLHQTFDEAPGTTPLEHKAWEKPHADNPTGTIAAYAPAGSIRRAQPAERRDYEAWQPE
ncbi:NADH:ubiquinone oxidoreductase subunit [Pacificibacter maritimus]|uniref:NADH:ubiquinone oxidoreductase subunit n=1 Tax=Pacificibacter maritimus TaxID=762213 RepID=A0A3N4UT13_9RHOB|nr:NADH:ubiquinone oxidoreductase subunit NDUFA12 [Pacificibacter maritimus]RPE71845.1 NADH:ubiquinone oxidoreductase subunit [Pacificibacter maritimus]